MDRLIEAAAQALANDIWHPPLPLSNLPTHEANKFRRQARIVLEAIRELPEEPGAIKEADMSNQILSEDEFRARFKARMVAYAGFTAFDDGKTVARYADSVARSYWQDQHKDGESPEECADSDMSYWGEE